MRRHAHRNHRSARPEVRAAHALDRELLFALMLLVSIVCAAILSGRPVEPVSVTRSVVVESGDTLWDIARLNPVDGVDTASAVDMIRTVNGLTGGRIVPGDQLVVPAAGDRTAVALR